MKIFYVPENIVLSLGDVGAVGAGEPWLLVAADFEMLAEIVESIVNAGTIWTGILLGVVARVVILPPGSSPVARGHRQGDLQLIVGENIREMLPNCKRKQMDFLHSKSEASPVTTTSFFSSGIIDRV